MLHGNHIIFVILNGSSDLFLRWAIFVLHYPTVRSLKVLLMRFTDYSEFYQVSFLSLQNLSHSNTLNPYSSDRSLRHQLGLGLGPIPNPNPNRFDLNPPQTVPYGTSSETLFFEIFRTRIFRT
jgi:hypothetical protein